MSAFDSFELQDAHMQIGRLRAERDALAAERDRLDRSIRESWASEKRLAAERDALAVELAEWKRMRNEAMAVATANRERIRELEAALQAIAVGMLPEDRAAASVHMYKLCASRLCGIARDAIIADGRGGQHG